MSKRYTEYGDSGVPGLGDFPAGWTTTRLKHVSTVQTGITLSGEGDLADPEWPYLRVANVQVGYVDLHEIKTVRVPADKAAASLLQPGDVLMTEGGDIDKLGRGALWRGELPDMLHQNHIFAVRPSEVLDSEFLVYWLDGPVARTYFRTTAKQTTNLAGTNKWTLGNLPIPMPLLKDQRAIADYLDRETARIDTLIEEQQHLVKMLRERRHSLIDGVFDMQVPNSRIQNACIDVVDCPHTTPEVLDNGEYEAVRTASVRNGKFRPGNGLPISRETWEDRNAGGAPAVGDVLFTREAPAGEACMVPHDQICLGQRMVLLRIDRTACVGEFLLWQIYSDRVQDHFRLSANGSTVANVRLPVLRTTPIWLPELDEQRRVAAYLDDQAAKIDTLIAETERFIELSKERRAALITAAVTGQIDVREMV